MAEISFTASNLSSLGADMRSVDLVALIGTMQVSFAFASGISWRAGDFSTRLDVGGSGLVAQVTNCLLTDVTAGTITGLACQGPGSSLTYRNTPALAADAFLTFLDGADWQGLAAWLRSGDDTISGTRNRDILLGGAGDDFLTAASSGNDVLTGGAGNDTLIASEGHDRLSGGAGADQFLFQSAPFVRSEFDRITDFQHGEDLIVLQRDGFGLLGTQAQFHRADLAYGHATTDAPQFVFIRATGRLFFDGDGTGASARILLAELTPGTQLSAQDFLLA